MKVFISYKHTGEDLERLKDNLDKVCSSIKEQKHEVFCIMLDNEEILKGDFDLKKTFKNSFENIDDSDIFLMFVNSSDLSTGMFIELGYAFAKGKRVILLINKNVQSYLRELIDEIIEFEDLEKLNEVLRTL